MPIYEYVCRDCGEEFELFVRSSLTASQHICPTCRSARVDKRFSTFASNARSSGGGSVAAASAPGCSGPI